MTRVQEIDAAALRGPPCGPRSDEELLAAAREGDSACFAELVGRYEARLLRFLYHRGAADDAEDLVQETFVRIYTNLHRYSSQWRFSTWLFTIARRISINHQQRFRVTADNAAVDAALSSRPGPAQIVAAAEHRQGLWDLAARLLGEEEYTALWLYYVEDVSPRAIGAILGRSWLAVKSIMFRARRKLSSRLREEDEYVS